MLDASILLRGQGVQAPNPEDGFRLAALARAAEMQRMQMDQQRRNQMSDEAIGGALGDLDITDDNQVRARLGQIPPEARQKFLTYVVAQRKAIADQRKDEAAANKSAFETDQAKYVVVGALAGRIAQNPTRDEWIAAQSTLQRMKISPDLLPPPSQGVDPAQHFTQIATGSMTRAQQMSEADKAEVRKQTKARDDATAENYLRTDARQRDMQAASLAQTKALRETGMAQAQATRDAAGMKRTADVEMKLADDYRAQSKGWQETATAIGKVRRALDTAATNPGSALAAGTAFMKILDPNSVVRESELGMALSASGWFDRAQNIAQTLRSGRVMTPQQVKNLRDASNALFEEAAATQRQIDAAFSKRAKDYGADPGRVLIDLGQNGPKQQPAVLKTAPAGSGVDYIYTPR